MGCVISTALAFYHIAYEHTFQDEESLDIPGLTRPARRSEA